MRRCELTLAFLVGAALAALPIAAQADGGGEWGDSTTTNPTGQQTQLNVTTPNQGQGQAAPPATSGNPQPPPDACTTLTNQPSAWGTTDFTVVPNSVVQAVANGQQPAPNPGAPQIFTCSILNVPGPAAQGIQWATNLASTVAQQLTAGTIRAYPYPAKQLVNMPDEVFVQGAGINGAQTALHQTLTLGGFTFTFETTLVDVTWDWGDGTTLDVRGPDGLGQNVHPPDGISTVEHRYDRIGAYTPRATETWAIAAFVTDPAGHITSIPQATNTFTPSTQSTFHLGQVEGIPAAQS